ncbi:cysteine desulfurase [Candidatus Saccharibacteria bacterium]|nr:cysteine desulfurase [Candidatus Saccharibacteria bacterium]
MIYLDHAAATPLAESARRAMTPYLAEKFFNPSAAYLPAAEVRREYEAAKERIAHVIGAKGADLVITSGATESINLAFSLVPSSAETLISAVEHPAVRANAQRGAKYQIVQVDANGRIDLADFQAKLNKNTQFVSVCLASSELGTVQPISDIARLIHAERQRRALAGEATPLYFHCDASQGLGLMEVKVARLGVDLLTINAAKIYGPKGVGALYVAHRVPLRPQVLGGGQEMGLRSGTENVPAVMAFAAAIEEAAKHVSSEQRRLRQLKQQLHQDLADLPNVRFLGHPKTQLPNYLVLSLPGFDAERLIFALEAQEVYLATGSACSANKGIKSPALEAIGLNDAEIAGSLRITLGKLNDSSNLAEAAKLIHAAVRAEQQRMQEQG